MKEVLVTIRELADLTLKMAFAREVADQIYSTDRGVVIEHETLSSFAPVQTRLSRPQLSGRLKKIDPVLRHGLEVGAKRGAALH